MSEWIYGKRTVLEHLKSLPKTAEKLVTASGSTPDPEIMTLAKTLGIPHEPRQRQKLEDLSCGGNHQGVCLLVADLTYADFDDIVVRAKTKAATPIIFALDSIQDPQNLGAIIRVADGLGSAGIIIPKDRAAGLTASVARSSAGAALTMPVAKVVNLARSLRELADEGFYVVGASSNTQKSHYEAAYNFPLVIVMGAEGEGLRQNVEKACDALVKIPMKGKVASLNVSVSAGIIGYEALRRLL